MDRDHQIGHAYFMDILSLSDLYKTWYYRLIPLLSEYFYNDLETIQSIIGKEFIDQRGQVKLIDYKTTDGNASPFEQAFMRISKGNVDV